MIQLYGGLEDHVVDEFGFKSPLCSENKGFTALGRWTLLNLLALNKNQPDWVPKFTKLGFEKAKIPPKIYSVILEEYKKRKSSPSQEACVRALINCEVIVSDEAEEVSSLKETQQTFMIPLSQTTLDVVRSGLQPLAETWSDLSLRHTATYGIR